LFTVAERRVKNANRARGDSGGRGFIGLGHNSVGKLKVFVSQNRDFKISGKNADLG